MSSSLADAFSPYDRMILSGKTVSKDILGNLAVVVNLHDLILRHSLLSSRLKRHHLTLAAFSFNVRHLDEMVTWEEYQLLNLFELCNRNASASACIEYFCLLQSRVTTSPSKRRSVSLKVCSNSAAPNYGPDRISSSMTSE